MGLFDEVKCEVPLPDARLEPGARLQTKSLSCCMDHFTITSAGKLIQHVHRYESARSDGSLGRHDKAFLKAVSVEDIDTQFHGDLRLSGATADGKLAEYGVRFTHGQLEWIRPYETLSAVEKRWFDVHE